MQLHTITAKMDFDLRRECQEFCLRIFSMAGTSRVVTQSFAIFLYFSFMRFHYSGGALHRSVETHHGLTGFPLTLDCGYQLRRANVENIDVWWKVSKNGVNRTLFASQNDVVTTQTEGYSVNMDRLLKGSASLHLLNTSVSDEGMYSCGVIIQPHHYDRIIYLKVSAQPSVSLPDLVTILPAEEKSIRCDITRFYPEQLKVTWKTPGSAAWDACTGIPVPNQDGTFNVSSRITVWGEIMNGGASLYACQIEHRSFPEMYSKNVTVRVQGSEQPYNTWVLIAVTVILSVFLTFSISGGVLMVYKHFHQEPLSVSEIITPEIIYAKVPVDLKCTITGARLKRLNVQWSKMGSSEAGHCNEIDSTAETETLSGVENLQDHTKLHSVGDVHISTLTVTLTIFDDNTEYCCIVICGHSKVIKKTVVSVKVQPDLLQISSQPQIPKQGQPLVLCCRVERFYPENIRLEWYTQSRELQPAIQFGPFSDHEGLHSIWSKSELNITSVDIGRVCTCRVYHSSFPPPFYKDVPYYINTNGRPPQVAFIHCEPSEPQLGADCILHLCATEFFPDPVIITWFKDGELISSGVFNSPSCLNVSGFFSMWTFLKLTVSKQNLNSVFKCLVEHSTMMEPETREFTLSHITQTPKRNRE